MYYAFIRDNQIDGVGQSRCLNDDIINAEISEEVFNAITDDKDRYIWNGEDVIPNPDYEQIVIDREKEHIGNLTMTKRVFALGLQEYGITYNQLKQLIATSEQAQLEWDLCVELQRKNPLLDVMAAQIGVTSEQLDNMFKRANGEIE